MQLKPLHLNWSTVTGFFFFFSAALLHNSVHLHGHDVPGRDVFVIRLSDNDLLQIRLASGAASADVKTDSLHTTRSNDPFLRAYDRPSPSSLYLMLYMYSPKCCCVT